jgi:hypothetical protein
VISTQRSLRILVCAALFFNLIVFPVQNLPAQLSGENTKLVQSENLNFFEEIKGITNKLFHSLNFEDKKKEKHVSKTLLEKLDFHYGVNEGYDRNVPLDSSHKGSFFTTQNVGVSYTDHIKNRFVYKLGYNLQFQDYYKFSDHNSLAQNFSVETALKLIPHHLFLEADYHFYIYRRQLTPGDDYIENGVKIGLKHYIIKDTLYQKPSYVFSHDGYNKFTARDALGTHGLTDRRDNINAFDHEVGLHLPGHLLLRVHNQIGRADSNDQFLKFYDYSYYQVTPILSWQPTKKWLLMGGFLFQRNNYDGRAIYGTAEKESLYSTFAGIYYHLNQYMTWKANCAYVKSATNIPELRFQDASFSSGLEFHF